MRAVIAGGGVAGLAAALALARAGHDAVVAERDDVAADAPPEAAFAVDRRGIPHYFQPHAFLPRGRQVLLRLAPDVLDALRDAGADEQDVAEKLSGPRKPGDEDLVYLWVRRPLIEWALRRAAAASGADLRSGETVEELLVEGGRARGVRLAGGEELRGDLVVDALGRYRPPAGWPRPAAEAGPGEVGAIYYCRYFRFADGAGPPEGPWLLNPRGDLGYMGFNTFRGDNRTFAVIFLVPAADRELRALRNERAWMAAAAAMAPLDVMTAPETATPVTDVLPMGGLTNVMRTAAPAVDGLVAIGDALCHTDPSFAYGLSFALAQAEALAAVSGDAGEYLATVSPELGERYEQVSAADAARVSSWAGEELDVAHRNGCYPLFSFAAALAAAPHDDHVLRRTVRRIGLLDRTSTFDEDAELHDRIERIVARLGPPPRPGPPRQEMLERIAT